MAAHLLGQVLAPTRETGKGVWGQIYAVSYPPVNLLRPT